MTQWIEARALDDVEPEDVCRFDHGGETYVICRDDKGEVFVMEGLCTHERVHLADGFVFGRILECPRHQGRFRLGDGTPCGGPALQPLRTFPVKVENGTIFIQPGSP
jgi:3-phenylpropionate/trans-cinnamate dioxygenase ferredoxin subunit